MKSGVESGAGETRWASAGPAGRWWLAGLLVVLGVYYWGAQWSQFAHWSDPTIYLAGARSLAEGHGYRFSAHLGQAPIGLYPPLQSLWMSLFWRLDPKFPENVPLLNGSMILLALGTMAISYAFLRRRGVPPAVAVGGLLVWGLSAKWSQFLYWLSSDIGFAGLAVGIASIWQREWRSGGTAVWWWTGVGLAVAYWWRTAALGLIAGTLVVAAWQMVRARTWLPLMAVGLPSGVAVVGWKLLAGAGRGYFSIWKVFVEDLGGVWGYFRNLGANVLSFLLGRVFWDMVCGTVVSKVERLGRMHPLAGVAAAVVPVVVFWVVVWLVVRGFRRRATEFDRSVLAVMAVYVVQIILVPFDAVHFHRYLYILLPFLGVWLWWGWNTLPAEVRRRSWVPVAAWVVVMGICVVNGGRARSDRRYMEELTPLGELREVAEWVVAKTPPEAKIALDFRLPTEHFHAWTGRPIVVDYFHPTYRTSPVTYESQGSPRADYVLSSARGQDVYPPPPGLPVAFASSRRSFLLLKVVEPARGAASP